MCMPLQYMYMYLYLYLKTFYVAYTYKPINSSSVVYFSLSVHLLAWPEI